jgi:transcription elongation factor Elf1
MKIVVKPKVKAKDKKIICPFCGEDKPFIRYIKKGILNRGIVKGKDFIDTNESVIPVEDNGLIKKVNL